MRQRGALSAGNHNYLNFIRIYVKRPCEDRNVGQGLFWCLFEAKQSEAKDGTSQVVELNISNEKKAEVVRTIIENVEVSAEADTHVQNMSAAAQRDGGTSAASVEIVNAGSEVAGAGAAADVSVDGVEVQE